MTGNRFGNRAGGDCDQIGGATDPDAVIGEAEDASGCTVPELEGKIEIGVGQKTLAIADQHRALQHVAAAIRRPGIADVIGAGEDRDPGGDQSIRNLLPGWMEKYRLMDRAVGTKKADDAWVERLSQTVYAEPREQAGEAHGAVE